LAKKGKLTGKAKASFLRRMAKGRNKKHVRKSSTRTSKKRSKPHTRRRSTKPLRRKSSSSKSMKHRRSTKRSRFAIPSIAKKAAAGIGLATIASVIVTQFAPQAAPIVRPIAAFAGGGIVGVVSDLILSGGGGLLGGFLGGSKQNQAVESV